MAKYAMKEMVDLNNEGQTLVYPKLIIDRCIDSKEVAKQMAKHSAYSQGVIEGVVSDFIASLAAHMAEGRSVKIADFGLLTPTLGYKKGVDRENAGREDGSHNATNLEVNDVKFRPEDSLLEEINKRCNLSWGKRKFNRKVSPYSEEERLAKALAYIEENVSITVSEYAQLSGLSNCSAGRELRKWVKDMTTGIRVEGRAPHIVYVKRDNK